MASVVRTRMYLAPVAWALLAGIEARGWVPDHPLLRAGVVAMGTVVVAVMLLALGQPFAGGWDPCR